MSVTLLTEHHLEFLSLKEAAQACLSLYLSKCQIVGNHMSWLKCIFRANIFLLSDRQPVFESYVLFRKSLQILYFPGIPFA